MNVAVSRDNGPKYDQIYHHLREQIDQHHVAPGDYLPPEQELAGEFGVSIGTIKKALGKLVDDGLIKRRRGHGTQVTGPPDAAPGRERQTSILILLGVLRRSFFGEVYSGILQELSDSGYQPILQENADSPEREREILETYCDDVAGAIIAPCSGPPNYQAYARLLAEQVPFVFVDRYLPRLNVDAAVSDNEGGGFLATQHLLELGHRRIAVVGRILATSMRDRLNGYRRALEAHGLPFDESLVFPQEDGGFDGSYELAEQMLAAHPDITAVFGMRDDAAWGCLQRMTDLGISVPDQVSVIGFGDDLDLCVRLRPRLTTVRQNKQELGAAAARLLKERLADTRPQGDFDEDGFAAPSPTIRSLKVDLIVRESTAPPGGGHASG